MFKNNKSLLVVALIAIVNALGYGIIIPILYSYSLKFGLSDFQNGLLFSLFSLCQFFSTPIIGRFSDKFGRKPLLVISLMGTVVSFVTMAFAPSAAFLFIARALDGLTAGNFPVIMAVISDTTKPEERAQGFGIVGGAFGFGMAIGPAISALTMSINPAIPFLIAAAITFVSVVLTIFLLPETNKHIGEVSHGKLFDFKKLAKAVFDENVGSTLLVSLLFALAFGLLIFAYQPFSKKILFLSDPQIAGTFTAFGFVGLIAQMVLIPRIAKRVQDKKLLLNALIVSVFGFLAIFVSRSYLFFMLASVAVSLANSFVQPLISSLLSKEVDAKSQGEIMGINTSYASIGTIVGPILGGALATLSIPMPFLAGGILSVLAAIVAWQIFRRPEKLVGLE